MLTIKVEYGQSPLCCNSKYRLGAEIDFVDINPDTLNMCPQLLEDKLREKRSSNKLPDILTVVHYAGNPVIWIQYTVYHKNMDSKS